MARHESLNGPGTVLSSNLYPDLLALFRLRSGRTPVHANESTTFSFPPHEPTSQRFSIAYDRSERNYKPKIISHCRGMADPAALFRSFSVHIGHPVSSTDAVLSQIDSIRHQQKDTRTDILHSCVSARQARIGDLPRVLVVA